MRLKNWVLLARPPGTGNFEFKQSNSDRTDKEILAGINYNRCPFIGKFDTREAAIQTAKDWAVVYMDLEFIVLDQDGNNSFHCELQLWGYKTSDLSASLPTLPLWEDVKHHLILETQNETT